MHLFSSRGQRWLKALLLGGGAVIALAALSQADAAPGVYCGISLATVVGTEGADVLIGTEGADVIVGLGGGDRIRGLGGDDIICAGDGNDFVDAGAGNDRVYGRGAAARASVAG